ncbi:hypothetical protein Poli38472_002951 [Pythium oligandrum]|uniref:Crinkler (CRN) family protein n=1 Tax=Pythium oligandrum TaxID=41045 RepID=A0A8K1C5X3_PYTOL|nr:hypothetical protein Poli38472_002951 [Pythium oligandrum]|eukprot:TMW57026.1 hypothetical protein Poli38472_002951 [Pythium oligandrum]
MKIVAPGGCIHGIRSCEEKEMEEESIARTVRVVCGVYGDINPFYVDISLNSTVDELAAALVTKWKPSALIGTSERTLYLARNEDGWLKADANGIRSILLGPVQARFPILLPMDFLYYDNVLGSSFQTVRGEYHVLARISQSQHQIPRTVVPAAESIAIPGTTVLNDPDKYAEECISLTEWGVDAVHEISSIWQFMHSLGGCTSNGKIFWRIEDKQVVSLLVDGWFRESTPDNINERANKKSILMGSPGIGKSTLLCVMAFYLVFKHKKNVLVYRRLTKLNQSNCLLYLGHQGNQVVHFAIPACTDLEARRIYAELCQQQGIENIWLLLDGLEYKHIPQELETFNLLATSQQVDLKSQERADAYCCLLPCWAKRDLCLLGNLVCKFAAEDMDERYYYSGGSVREFTLSTIKLIREGMAFALTRVTDATHLLSTKSNVTSGELQLDRLCHTFVNDATDMTHFTGPQHWQQIVDSEYVVRELSLRLPINTLALTYQWARATGHGSLAGCALELYIHRLAADNRLKLYASEYDPPTFRKPDAPRAYEFKQVPLRGGSAAQWGTSSDYKTYLTEWRGDDMLTYWFPACDNFPNIDSIVKLESTISGKKGGVAYLQVTVAKKHDISHTHMQEMNNIFGIADDTEPPIYIAICPDRKSCQEFVLDSRPEVVLARRTCRLFVGYYEEDQFAIAADGPKNNISVKPVPPEHTYNTRKRQRAS